MAPLLRVRDLKYGYPGAGQPTLDGLDLDVEAGEIVGVLGASGCGKTTLFRVLTGLWPPGAPATGDIVFEGRSLLEVGWGDVRGRRLGSIFQAPETSLHPLRRVGQQVADLLEAHGPRTRAADRRGRVAAAFARVGLDPELCAAYPHQLSGGQRQRVVVCQALIAGPTLVLADEPTASLDAENKTQLVALIRQLRDELGVAFLWVSHDLALLGALADRIVVLEAGRAADQGSPEELARSPVPITRRLLAAENPPQPLAALPPAQPWLRAEKIGVRYHRGPAWWPTTYRVFADLDFVWQPGEAVGLWGPSGAGKSTLARCLAGIEAPETGHVLQDGHNLWSLPAAQRRRLRRAVIWVGQEPRRWLEPRWPAWKLVAEAWAYRGADDDAAPRDPRAAAQRWLATVGLEALAERPPTALSGGQLQRLVLARALAAHPRALILDEALSALDGPARQELVAELRRLREHAPDASPLGLLWIGHDPTFLAGHCHRVLRLEHGHLVATAPPKGNTRAGVAGGV